VNLFAYIEGNKVLMEGFFTDGNKPKNCVVVVKDSNGTELLRGKTDDEGKFSFDIPAITDLNVVLDAGMGHRALYKIPSDELKGATPKSVPATTEVAQTEDTLTSSDVTPSSIDRTALREEIGRANASLIRSIEELKESTNFSNIVGGIGFIVGIFGVIFYVMGGKKLEEAKKLSNRNT
jgi:nickel transport protein